MAKQTSIASFFNKSPKPGKIKEEKSPQGHVHIKGKELQLMDLVWAKLEGHPWWPALVCNSPGDDTFTRRNQIHVQFFDKPPTRGWVKDGLIKPYGPAGESGIPSYRDATWIEAVREAEEAQQLPKDDRLLLLVDMLPSDDEDLMDGIEEEEEDDSDKSKENVSEVNGRGEASRKTAKGEPKTKRRRIILHSDSESEEDYKPADESGESDDSGSSGVDEGQVSGPETESEVDSPVKVPGLHHCSTSLPPPPRKAGCKVKGGTFCQNMRVERQLEACVLDSVRRGHPPSLDALQMRASLLRKESSPNLRPSSEWLAWLEKLCSVEGRPSERESKPMNYEVRRQVQRLVKEGYSTQQVFVVEMTGVRWNKLACDDGLACHRLTVMLCFNAAGDCRLKPLVVAHHKESSMPRNTLMSCLPVVWKANRRARVTAVMFDDWFVNHFVPTVQEHCRRNGLPERAVLLVTNTRDHPSHLLDHPHIKTAYLPSSSPWPLDQGVSTAFTHHYLRLGIQSVTNTQTNIWDLWKEVDVKMALRNVALSWDLIRTETLNKAWSDIWPEAVRHTHVPAECPFEDIFTVMKDRGVDRVSEGTLNSLVSRCQEELSREERSVLDKEQVSLEEDGLDDIDPVCLTLTPWDLQEILDCIDEVCILVKDNKGGQELCTQLKEASKDYRDLVSLEGKDSTILPSQGKDSTILPSQGKDTTMLPSQGKDSTTLPSQGKDTTMLPSQGKDTTILPSQGTDSLSLTQIKTEAEEITIKKEEIDFEEDF